MINPANIIGAGEEHGAQPGEFLRRGQDSVSGFHPVADGLGFGGA